MINTTIPYFSDLAKKADLSITEALLYGALWNFKKSGSSVSEVIEETTETLSKLLNVSTVTISKALNTLRDQGLILEVSNRGRGKGYIVYSYTTLAKFK